MEIYSFTYSFCDKLIGKNNLLILYLFTNSIGSALLRTWDPHALNINQLFH